MFTVNRVTLLGNVTHDPEVRATKSGTPLVALGFATDQVRKDDKGEIQREPEYHRLVCFGPLAEFTAKTVKKGAPLYAEGRLHTSKWEKTKGQPQSRTEIIVDRLVLLSPKKGSAVETPQA